MNGAITNSKLLGNADIKPSDRMDDIRYQVHALFDLMQHASGSDEDLCDETMPSITELGMSLMDELGVLLNNQATTELLSAADSAGQAKA